MLSFIAMLFQALSSFSMLNWGWRWGGICYPMFWTKYPVKSANFTKHHLHRSCALILFNHLEITLIPWIGFSLIPQGIISRLNPVISTTVDGCCMKPHGMTLTARVYQDVLILPSCSCLSMAFCMVCADKKKDIMSLELQCSRLTLTISY
jgi:hypothetical protein